MFLTPDSRFFLLLLLTTKLSIGLGQPSRQYELKDGKYQLTLAGAEHFADLPLRCMQREFPYKTGIAFPDSTLAVKPREYHPAFYGCFDWHSSVHGHWMLVRWRILPDTSYQRWVQKFLPALGKPGLNMEPGKVNDRSDGKLVHLDGLNLSRAWDLYGIARHLPANRSRLYALANKHLTEALPNVASGDYMGEHWLASFAVYALTMQ